MWNKGWKECSAKRQEGTEKQLEWAWWGVYELCAVGVGVGVDIVATMPTVASVILGV
jgi:hypothetical protein